MPRPRPAASRAGARCTASSSPAPCRATAGDRTGSILACSRTEKRAPERSCRDQPRCVNDHRGRIRAWSRPRRSMHGYPRRMRRPRWQRPEPASHGSGPRRPRHPQWPGRLPGRAAGAPQRQVPRRGGNALVRSSMPHLSRRPDSGSDTTQAPGDLPYGGMPSLRQGQEPGQRTGARARCGHLRERSLEGSGSKASSGSAGRPSGLCHLVRTSRTPTVLTPSPAACQEPGSTRYRRTGEVCSPRPRPMISIWIRRYRRTPPADSQVPASPPRSGQQQCRMMGHDAEQDVFRRPAASVNVPPQLPNLSS